MKKHFITLSLILSVFFSCANKPQEGVSLVKPNEFNTVLAKNNVQLIDVRTTDEFTEDHIANAVHMNVNEDSFEINAATLDKNAPICVYCKSGGRSAKAAGKLKAMGFTQIYDLDGGITAWKKANLPVQK